MYDALKKIMLEHGIPEYQPDAVDQQVLLNWKYTHPDLSTDEGKLYNLISRIYNFDYFYNYSDDGKVWRTWHTAEQDIDREIMAMEDRELAESLSAHRSDEKSSRLVDVYPWLGASKYSAYAVLLKDGYSTEEALVLLGMVDWIKTIQRNAKVGFFDNHVLYASDIPLATKKLRAKEITTFDGETLLTGMSVPNNLFQDLRVLAEILELKGPFTKLRKLYPSLNLGIQYIEGFTQYQIGYFYILV